MDAERYARVRDLFLAVDELAQAEQDEFLIRQCGDDIELIAEVKSLLAEHNVTSALREGSSAKQPVLPQQSPADPSTQTGDTDGTQTGHVFDDVEESVPNLTAASPFLPNAQSAAIDSDAVESDRDSATASRAGKRRIRHQSKTDSRRSDDSKRDASAKDRASQVTQHGSQRTHASPRYANERPNAKRAPTPGLWKHRARKHRRFNSWWLLVAAVLPTVLVGWWTYNQVSHSIRQATQNELAGVADSVRISVKRFLDDQARLAESWARQPDLRDAIIALIETPEDKDFVKRLQSSPHASEIRSQLIALSERDDIKYVVWDRTGRIIASWLPDGADIGSDVSPDGAANLNRAGRGETVLFGPEILRDDTRGFQPETNRPVMAEIMPIRDESGRIIATMLIRGFGMYDSFDAIFRQASEAGGLDVYAVSTNGVMVSNSPQAMRTVKISGGNDGDSAADFIACQLRVSDPSKSQLANRLALDQRRMQPLTYAAADASNGRSGNRLDAYPNYAGVPVVGAWRWVEDWDFGIVVERNTEDAFATARIVRLGFFALAIMLMLTALTAAAQIAKRSALAQAAVHPLSRYDLVTELGSGGMGVVYRARHSQLGRDTALKVLRGDRDNLEDRLRFDREAKLAASLSSPHTVTIYDYGRSEDGEAYCVMEFLRGITLYDVVARSGFQNYGRVLYILRQICDSLGEAHKLGLVHRDVKPQNVMLSLDASVGDWAVVFDFGLAKPLQPDADSYQTAETIWAGNANVHGTGTLPRAEPNRSAQRHLLGGLHRIFSAYRPPPVYRM